MRMPKSLAVCEAEDVKSEVVIKIPDDNNFLLGEKVLINPVKTFVPPLKSKAPAKERK